MQKEKETASKYKLGVGSETSRSGRRLRIELGR
jgi:hypothetical protein